jgi:hypothetical protein
LALFNGKGRVIELWIFNQSGIAGKWVVIFITFFGILYFL